MTTLEPGPAETLWVALEWNSRSDSFHTAASERNACTASCTAGISLGGLGGLLAARATMGKHWEAAAVLRLS
jgi:hypothetical protein